MPFYQTCMDVTFGRVKGLRFDDFGILFQGQRNVLYKIFEVVVEVVWGGVKKVVTVKK